MILYTFYWKLKHPKIPTYFTDNESVYFFISTFFEIKQSINFIHKLIVKTNISLKKLFTQSDDFKILLPLFN